MRYSFFLLILLFSAACAPMTGTPITGAPTTGTPTTGTPTTVAPPSARPVCAVVTEPSESALLGRFAEEASAYLQELERIYASTYQGLSYSYEVTSAAVVDNRGSIVARYQGSVTGVGSGTRETASGTVTADFSWTGCAWTLDNFTY